MSVANEAGGRESHHVTYLAGRALPALIGFLAVISYSHVVSPAVYGEFAVAMGVANILIGVLFMWIRTTLTRFGATGDAKGERMIGVGLALHLGLTAVLLASLSVMALALQNEAFIPVGGLAAAIAWSDINLDLLRARHQARRYGLQYFIRQVLTVSIVVTVLLAGVDANPIIVGFIIGNALSSLLMLGQAWPRPAYRFSRADVREFLAYGLPLSLNYGLASLTYTLDRIVVFWLLGKEAAGIYSLAADIVIQVLGVLMEGITLAFLPGAARALDRGGRQAASAVLGENLLVLLGLAVPAALGLAVCGPALGMLILGSEFGGGDTLIVPLLAIAFLFRGIRVYFVDNVLQLHHRSNLASAATALSVGSLAVFCPLLTPALDLSGAAIAVVISNVIACAMGLLVAGTLLTTRYPVAEIAKILAASALSAGIAQVVLMIWGVWGVFAAIVLGVVGYAAAIWLANPAQLRTRLQTAVVTRT